MDAQLRSERWPVILAEEIEAARERPFAWGTHDCATWAFSVAAKLRGEAAPAWIGSYRTRIGAFRKLKAAGIDLADGGSVMLGAPLASPLLAQRGDVVFSSETYGVCIGRDVALVSDDGLVLLPLSVAERAWRV